MRAETQILSLTGGWQRRRMLVGGCGRLHPPSPLLVYMRWQCIDADKDCSCSSLSHVMLDLLSLSTNHDHQQHRASLPA